MGTTRSISTPAGIVIRVILGLVVVVGVLLAAAPAGHAQQDPYSKETPTVEPSLIVQDNDPEPEPPEDPPEDSTTRVLPFTGGEVTTFLVAGLLAIAIGTALVRRRSSDERGSETTPR